MKRLFIMFLVCFTITNIFAAYLENIPSSVTQPDGTVIDVLLSGDEFHSWAHDASGFTIIQDPTTGYWCWAIPSVNRSGDVQSSGFPIHLHQPESLNISPNVNISDELYIERRLPFDEESSRNINRSPNIGTLQSITILIRFSDQDEFAPENITTLYNMLNAAGTGVNSMYQYYLDVSFGQLEVYSPMYPRDTNDFVVSYQDEYPRAYFMPYDATTNPTGYNEDQRRGREHALLIRAINAVADQIPPDVVADADADDNGYIDNMNFIIRGDTTAWNTLLWPHKWDFTGSPNVKLQDKGVWTYNLNMEVRTLTTSGVGVLAHEFAHALGLPDLYRSVAAITPVGPWCLMATNTNPPQSISAYMKQKYTNWITDIPTLTSNGVYALNPVSTHQTGMAYRINTPESTTEHFIVEYRNNTLGLIDQRLPSSGLLIYRVIPSRNGNFNSTVGGQPDEVYVYRTGGTSPSVNGTPAGATFSTGTGRTAINATTNPSPFLSDGTQSGLDISNITGAGTTISFTVNSLGSYIEIGDQSDEIYDKMAGSVSFTVTTTDIADGQIGTVAWYISANNGNIIDPPEGVTATITPVTTNSATIDIETSSSTPAGTFYFRATIDGKQSSLGTLTISEDLSHLGNYAIVGPDDLYSEAQWTNLNILVNFATRSGISQTIYFESEIGKTGLITNLEFYFNGHGDIEKPYKVQLYYSIQSNTFTEFSGNGAYIRFNDAVSPLTLIYDQYIDVSNISGETTVLIPLDTPIDYKGGNLIIGTEHRLIQPIQPNYNAANRWQITTRGPNRTVYNQAASIDRNFAEPTNGSRTNMVPVTKFIFEPESGNTVFNPPTNFRLEDVSLQAVELAWDLPEEGSAGTVSGFRIYRDSASGEKIITIDDPNATSYTDDLSQVLFLDDYTYYITALYNNHTVESEPSASVTAELIKILPVTLTEFKATSSEDGVVVSWITETEMNMTGYRILRAETNDLSIATYITQGYITANNLSHAQEYTYIDSEVTRGNEYYYWLVAFENDGTFEYFGPVNAVHDFEDEQPIIRTQLGNIYPNPMNTGTLANIEIAVKADELAELKIYNIRGQVVRSYENITEGSQTIIWDGRDTSGRNVSSGVYFFNLTSLTSSTIKKTVLLR